MSRRAYIATRKGLFTLERNGDTWGIASAAFLGSPVTAIAQDKHSGRLYAGLKHEHFGAKLHRSDDGGKVWSEVGTPTYPERPEDVPAVMCPVRNIEIPWSLHMIWALTPDTTIDGGLWCGTIPGGLFHSKDHGETWELVRSLWNLPNRSKWFGGGYDYPGIHSVLVDPNDGQHVTVGISCGGVWTSTDTGQTWESRCKGMRAEYVPPEIADSPDIQDPHILVACHARHDHFWVQHHNGIFRSTNGGEQWSEITEAGPSTFGFVAAVHPGDPDTAWFVPAVKDEERVPVDGKFVVTRTRDGGRTFDVLTEGLPHQHAYDIVYRHALAVDGSGNTLLMGSTTGSVWSTANQGDTWDLVSSNLPPVNAVFLASDNES